MYQQSADMVSCFQTNYKRQADRRILANAGVYGQKVRMDALHNALVNNKGQTQFILSLSFLAS